MSNKKWLLVLVLVLCSFSAWAADDFDQDNSGTWENDDGAYKDDVYTKVDPDDPKFDWSKADYSKVQWEKVDEFKNVDVKKIPDDKWGSVRQENIKGEKVADIPPKHFDPTQVKQENRKYATVEQIAEQIGKFDNLKHADGARVKQVFAEKYKVDVDISGTEKARFDPESGKLSGEFAVNGYKPSEFPIGKYKQVITGDEVDIIELPGGKKFSVKNADGFSRRDDGSITAVLGERKTAIIDGIPAFVQVDYDKQVKVEGKVTQIGESFLLESFDGKQSSYYDADADILVESVGYPLIVHPKDTPVPLVKFGGVVGYDMQTLLVQGNARVRKDDFTVSAKTVRKDEIAVFSLDESGGVLVRGLVTYEDPGMKYEGLSGTSAMTRKVDENAEFMSINGGLDGPVAHVTRKMKVGDLLAAKGLGDTEVGIGATIYRSGNKVSAVMDADSLGTIADIGKEPTKSLLVEKNLILRLGSNEEPSGYVLVSADAGIRYEPTEGTPLSVLSPAKTEQYLGKDNTGIMLARALLKFTARGYAAGDQVMASIGKNGAFVQAKVVAVNGDQIVLDVNGELKEIKGDTLIVGHLKLSDSEVKQRLKQKPLEATQLLLDEEQKHKGQQKGGQLALARFSIANTFKLPMSTTITGTFSLQTPGGTPLYYRTEIVDGKEKITGWSADQVTWMGLDTAIVKGGQYDGQSPTETNRKLIDKINQGGGNPEILRVEVRENSDYKLVGSSIETKIHDEWFDNFKKDYGEHSSLVQQAGIQVAEAYRKEGKTDVAISYYKKVADMNPNSYLGKLAQANVNTIGSLQGSVFARQISVQLFMENMGRDGTASSFLDGKEYVDALTGRSLPDTFFGVLTGAGNPYALYKSVTREGTVAVYEAAVATQMTALNAHDQLVNSKAAKDTDEALALINIAVAPTRFGTEPIPETNYQEGKEYVTYSIRIPNPDNKLYDTSGEDIVGYQLRKNENGRIEIRFTDGDDFGGKSDWEDLELFNNAARGTYPRELIEKADRLKAEGAFNIRKADGTTTSLTAQHSQFLQNEPTIQIGIEMRKISIGDPARDEKLLQIVENERGRRNYAAAAMVAREVAQTSSSPETRAKAQAAYENIVDANKEWFTFADASLDRATVLQTAGEFANPVSMLAMGTAGNLVGKAAVRLPGGVKVVSLAGKVMEFPAEFFSGVAEAGLGKSFVGKTLAGGIKQGVDEGGEEFLEAVIEDTAGPEAAFVVSAVKGGGNALDNMRAAQKNAMKSALRNGDVRVGEHMHLRQNVHGKVEASAVVTASSVNVAELEKAGKVEVARTQVGGKEVNAFSVTNLDGNTFFILEDDTRTDRGSGGSGGSGSDRGAVEGADAGRRDSVVPDASTPEGRAGTRETSGPNKPAVDQETANIGDGKASSTETATLPRKNKPGVETETARRASDAEGTFGGGFVSIEDVRKAAEADARAREASAVVQDRTPLEAEYLKDDIGRMQRAIDGKQKELSLTGDNARRQQLIRDIEEANVFKAQDIRKLEALEKGIGAVAPDARFPSAEGVQRSIPGAQPSRPSAKAPSLEEAIANAAPLSVAEATSDGVVIKREDGSLEKIVVTPQNAPDVLRDIKKRDDAMRAQGVPTNSYDLRKEIIGRSNGKITTANAYTYGELPSDRIAQEAYLANPENWMPERRAVQQKIYDIEYAKAKDLSDRLADNAVYALRGNTAAGKSTALKRDPLFNKALDASGEASGAINPDTVKSHLRNEDVDLVGDHTITHFQTNAEGSAIAKRLVNDVVALEETRTDSSMVIDRRLSAAHELEEVIKLAESADKDVKILDIDAPLETSVVRVLQRQADLDSPLVPFGAVADGYAGIRKNRAALIERAKNNPRVKNYVLYAYDANGESVKVAEKSNGEFKVHDQQLFDQTVDPNTEQTVNQIAKTTIDDAYIARQLAQTPDKFKAGVKAALEPYKGKTMKEALDQNALKINEPKTRAQAVSQVGKAIGRYADTKIGAASPAEIQRAAKVFQRHIDNADPKLAAEVAQDFEKAIADPSKAAEHLRKVQAKVEAARPTEKSRKSNAQSDPKRVENDAINEPFNDEAFIPFRDPAVVPEFKELSRGAVRTHKDGVFFGMEDLQKHGLLPTAKVEIDGKTIYLTDKMRWGFGQDVVIGYVEHNGDLYMRPFYISRSQKVARTPSHYELHKNEKTGRNSILYIGKGKAEETTNLALELTPVMHNMPYVETNLDTSFYKSLLNDYFNLYWADTQPYVMLRLQKTDIKTPPQSLELANPLDGPDYTRLEARYSFDGDTLCEGCDNEVRYGKMQGEYYLSKNGEVRWLILRDAHNRVMIGGAELVHEPISEFGTRQQFVVLGKLGGPIVEYKNQIHPDFKGKDIDSVKGKYADNTRFIERIPLIQEYRAVTGVRRPEVDPTTGEAYDWSELTSKQPAGVPQLGAAPIPQALDFPGEESIVDINNRIQTRQVEGLENRVKMFFDSDPARAGAFIDNEYLASLGLGGEADFFAAAGDIRSDQNLRTELKQRDLSSAESLTESTVAPKKIQYIKGRYGVELSENNGFRTVLYHDGNSLRTVEVPDHDLQVIGGLSAEDNNRMRRLFDAEIEAKTEVQTRTNSKGKQVKEVVRGFDEKEMNDKAIKRVAPLSGTTIDDVVERQIGVSERVAAVGRNVKDVSNPETVTTASGEKLIVRTFTLTDGTQHKFPVAKFDQNGNLQPILFEQKLADGTTLWNSEDVHTVTDDRLPDSLRQANLEGRVTYVVEGSREDVAAYMKGQDVAMDAAQRFVIVGQGGGGVPYDLYVGRRPDGSDMYVIGKIAGDSKRQRVESLLVQSGFDASRIAVIDFNRDYTAQYADVLGKAQPDIVIMGDERQIEEIVKSYGGSIGTVVSGLGEMKTFDVEIKGEKKRVLFTDTQNGELARHLTEAITASNKHVKLGVSGDSGGHAELKRMYNEFNSQRKVPVRDVPSFEAYTPGSVKLPNGQFVQVDNKMVKAQTKESVTEGSQTLIVHHNTWQGNAFSSTEEDIGWILRNMDVDNTDVEMGFIAEAMDKARGSGRTPPELHILFHVEDQIAVGNPIGTRGHSFPQELKHIKDKELLRSLFEVEDLSDVTFVDKNIQDFILEAES